MNLPAARVNDGREKKGVKTLEQNKANEKKSTGSVTLFGRKRVNVY